MRAEKIGDEERKNTTANKLARQRPNGVGRRQSIGVRGVKDSCDWHDDNGGAIDPCKTCNAASSDKKDQAKGRRRRHQC